MRVATDPLEVLAQLVQDFTYRADVKGDCWRVLPGSGPVFGDCEDFALSLGFRLAGGSWWRFLWHLLIRRSVIWYCRTSKGGGHAVLWHHGTGWADNIFPNWSAAPRHMRRWPFPVSIVALKLLYGWISHAQSERKNVQRAQKGGRDDR
jgi:hypothetical protein